MLGICRKATQQSNSAEVCRKAGQGGLQSVQGNVMKVVEIWNRVGPILSRILMGKTDS